MNDREEDRYELHRLVQEQGQFERRMKQFTSDTSSPNDLAVFRQQAKSGDDLSEIVKRDRDERF